MRNAEWMRDRRFRIPHSAFRIGLRAERRPDRQHRRRQVHRRRSVPPLGGDDHRRGRARARGPGARRRSPGRDRRPLRRAAREGGDLLVVNDIPLLFEALDPAQFDAVVLVDAGVALRRTRLRAMRGLSNDEADRMIAAQMPAERKRAKSDVVIDNEGSLEQLERQARAAFDELRHRAAVAALGGRPARVLLLAAAGAREQPTLNPIAARYADAGLAVRRVTGDAAAIERALGQPATPDAIVATAAAAAAAEQAWADAGRPGVLTSLSA